MTMCVLLSSYNGEKYIVDQIDSLLSQTVSGLKVLIRDDGSTDGTRLVLSHYESNPAVKIVFERNVGVVRSFLRLLEIAPEAEVYAFCDQDDWWHPEKLQRATDLLRAVEGPGAVCCRIAVTDEKLNIKHYTDSPPRGYTFANALVENIATGCSLCINAAARNELLKSLPCATEVVMHDWWIYQVVTATGRILFDPQPGVWYRQHGSNAVGSANGLENLRRRIRRLSSGSSIGLLRRQSKELDRCLGDRLTAQHRSTLKLFCRAIESKSRLLRIWRAMRVPVYRQRWFDNVVLKAFIAAGRM